MTGRTRTRATSPTTMAARLALAGVAVSLGALALAGPASADPPVDPNDPSLLVANPGAPAPAGQPVVEAAPPGPGDTGGNFDPSQAVGHVADDQAHYGSGSGPLGFLRDAWNQAKDPGNFGATPDGEFPTSAPPPGAGPAPKLPPGYTSTNAPGSETPMAAVDPNAPKPAPPPGYIRMDDGRLAPDPAGPPPALQANGQPVPPPYVPVHSPPPPPLLPEDPGPPPF